MLGIIILIIFFFIISVCNHHNKTPSPSPSYSGPQSPPPSSLCHTQTTSSPSPVSHSGPQSPLCHSSSLHNSPEMCPPSYNICVSKENHCHRDNNHRDSNHRNNKIPPAIPPKQHRHSRTHSSNSSLQNGLGGRNTVDLQHYLITWLPWKYVILWHNDDYCYYYYLFCIVFQS